MANQNEIIYTDEFKIGEPLGSAFTFQKTTVAAHLRDLIQDISQAGLEGKQLVDRRLELLPEHATFHEDYGPIFMRILGLAVNAGSILKHQVEHMEEVNASAPDPTSATQPK